MTKKKKEKRAIFDPRVTLMGGLSNTCILSRDPQIRPLLCENGLILVVGSWRACHQGHLPFPYRGLVWGCHLGVKEPSNLLYISLLWNLLVLRGSRPRRRSHGCQGKVLSIGTHASLFASHSTSCQGLASSSSGHGQGASIRFLPALLPSRVN